MAESAAQEAVEATGRRAEEFSAREHFERLYSNWLRLRAGHADPDQDESDAAANARAARVEEAARRLLSTPVALSWMIWHKWEVMQSWLDHADTSWTDNRITFALGCIAADLARYINPAAGIVARD